MQGEQVVHHSQELYCLLPDEQQSYSQCWNQLCMNQKGKRKNLPYIWFVAAKFMTYDVRTEAEAGNMVA